MVRKASDPTEAAINKTWKPSDIEPVSDLGAFLLATSADPKVRDPKEAAAAAEKPSRQNPTILHTWTL